MSAEQERVRALFILILEHQIKPTAEYALPEIINCLLGIPCLRIEADDQTLPKVPSGVGYCKNMQEDMLKAGWVRVVKKEIKASHPCAKTGCPKPNEIVPSPGHTQRIKELKAIIACGAFSSGDALEGAKKELAKLEGET